MNYRVDLDIYNGPMDLLLYLIHREEVQIADIPIVRITEQYLAYLDLLTAMDINIAGEFLVTAATLMEIKSRMLLPRPELEDEDGSQEDQGDPRLELVRQLLEYKRFKEAAQDLELLGSEQSRRFARPAALLVAGPEEQRYALDQMMQKVELWDLLNAFARVMQSINVAPTEVIYDDTPVEEMAEQIVAVLSQRRTVLFSELFAALFTGYEQVGRSHLISTLLAILECIRRRLIGIQQDDEFGDLRMFRLEEAEEEELEAAQMPPAPPEARIASIEDARQAEGFDRSHGRIKDELHTDEVQRTEFDEQLEAIVVPEVEKYKPIYSDDEIMGRQETDQAGDATADKPGQTPADEADDSDGGDKERPATDEASDDEAGPVASEQEDSPPEAAQQNQAPSSDK
ncbi:MAG: segregation/condensation protein A [Anaerolineaceae bacterium]|nr:segregation/condensation protein A [Anaerolineaceae bacterium]